jgi:hypothetical protein
MDPCVDGVILFNCKQFRKSVEKDYNALLINIRIKNG